MSTFEQLQRDPLITQEGAKDLLNFNSDTLNDEDMKEKLFDLKHDQDFYAPGCTHRCLVDTGRWFMVHAGGNDLF